MTVAAALALFFFFFFFFFSFVFVSFSLDFIPSPLHPFNLIVTLLVKKLKQNCTKRNAELKKTKKQKHLFRLFSCFFSFPPPPSPHLVQKPGSPHAAGSNSSRLPSTEQALPCASLLGVRSSGTKTQRIPAASAASTPMGASSKTSTLAGEVGGGSNFEAASSKISGWGLPLLFFVFWGGREGRKEESEWSERKKRKKTFFLLAFFSSSLPLSPLPPFFLSYLTPHPVTT